MEKDLKTLDSSAHTNTHTQNLMVKRTVGAKDLVDELIIDLETSISNLVDVQLKLTRVSRALQRLSEALKI